MINLKKPLQSFDKQKQNTRKEKDRLRRRNDILAAVERLGEEQDKYSFDKLNLDYIAAEAGLTKPTIYRYFNSKDDLMIGFAAYSFYKVADFIGNQLKIHQHDDVSHRLQAISIAYYQFARNSPAVFKILNDLGRENRYVILHAKLTKEKAMRASGEILDDVPTELTDSEFAYLTAWENFRETLKQAFKEDEISLVGIIPSQSIQSIALPDFIEVLSIVINGVITELSNRNKILPEHGILDEDVLAIIMQLLGKGLKS